MASRQVLYMDSVIGAIADNLVPIRAERGDLNDAQASIASVIYDVLWWIGIPEGAIRLALGKEADAIQSDKPDGVACAFCDETAVGLLETEGGWRLVCQGHADGATEADWTVMLQPTRE